MEGRYDTTDSLRPFSEYPTEAAYIADARLKAPLFGIDPDVAAALAEGVADMEMGRTIALEDVIAQHKAARALRRQKREAAGVSAASLDD